MRRKVFEIARGDFSQVEKNFWTAYNRGLFDSWFPLFERLQGCNQGYEKHFEGDALTHTCKVFAHASQFIGLDEDSRFVLLSAALAHDVRKPQTRRRIHSKITFRGHEEMAALECPVFARRLVMDLVEAECFEWVVRNHGHAHKLQEFGEIKRLGFYRSPYWPVLRALQKADALSIWRSEDGSDHEPVLFEFFVSDHRRIMSAAS